MFYEFSIGGFEECAETLVERRSDEAFKLLLLRTRVTKFIERMLETSNDSLTRVAQGTVQIEEYGGFQIQSATALCCYSVLSPIRIRLVQATAIEQEKCQFL